MSSVIYLQGIGEKPAKMVSELSEGDIFLKNYGYKYRIIACESLTDNVYELTFESLNSTDPGCRYSKTVRGSTLVGIHEDEGVQDLNEDMRLMQQLHMAQKRATDRKRKEDEERERKRRENQELSANKQVSGEFAGAREETIADKILNFMSERKFSKAEIKKRKKVGDKLPKGEFKKKYSNPKPPAKSWKDVLWATATNIVKGEKTEESVEVEEAIADGKPKSKSQRRMDVAISKIDRAFPETKNQKWAKQRGGFSGYDRIQSAASRMQRGHDPEKMKKEPDDVFQNTSDVRAAEKLMKKRRQRSKKASIQDSVQKNILSQLKDFDMSGEGLDVPSINNKEWGPEGIKKEDGKFTNKDKNQ